ncbi:hypothetical protein Tco_1169116 [Tanacetum coccineum]
MCRFRFPDHLCLIGLTLPHGNKYSMMLLEGSELTKEDRESQLYGDFELSVRIKGENHSTTNYGLSPTDNLIKNLTNTLSLLTQSYKTYLPQTNNQLKTSSNTRNQATVQDGRDVVQNVQGRQNRGQGNNARGAGAAGYGGAQNRVGNANPAQENGVALDEEQLLFLVGGQDNAVDEDVDEQPIQAADCDAFD